MVRGLDPVPGDVRIARSSQFHSTQRVTEHVVFLDQAFSRQNNSVLSVSIDTVAADISTAGYLEADAWASVSTDAVVLNGDLRWLSDFDTAAFVVVDVVPPDEQPFAAGKMDSVTCIVENGVVVNTSIIFVWSRACWK